MLVVFEPAGAGWGEVLPTFTIARSFFKPGGLCLWIARQ
ncbi:hypothetical protein SAMN05880582_11222 [Rhizobium sp. RU20A]|nr:hypothetical protein SAMN05880582_11222 [Rhizobium sp. RU20A]